MVPTHTPPALRKLKSHIRW